MAIYLVDKQMNVVPVKVGSPVRLDDMEAVAVINAANSALNCLKLERGQFIAIGNKEGAALML